MEVCVIGGGNIGMLLCAELASRGHGVRLFTSRANDFSTDLSVYDATDKFLFSGILSVVTSDLAVAVGGAEVVLLTLPSFTFKNFSALLLPVMQKGQILCVIPGSGGAEFAFADLVKKGVIFMGLQRVHSIARIKTAGKEVFDLGKKSQVEFATIPSRLAQGLVQKVQQIFGMKAVALDNYLCVTLTPSNPILHPTRLFSMFSDFKEGVFYDKNVLFYEEWTDHSSAVLFGCDDELQLLCKEIPLSLSAVKPLKVHYESCSVQAFTQKIRSIKAFKGLTSPMKQAENGLFVPDFSSRYFVADFCFGLKVILEIAKVFGVQTPNMIAVWQWYKSLCPDQAKTAFTLDVSKQDFIELYK